MHPSLHRSRRRAASLTLILVTTLLATSCSLPAAYGPPGAKEGPEGATSPAAVEGVGPAQYTEAAQTISAQLTEILRPATDTPALETNQAGPTIEPLPATSTPLPTRTPLPSDTPTVTPTPIPTTPAPTDTPTVVSLDPRDSLGEPDFSDRFSSLSNWPIYNDEHVEMAKAETGLALTALKADKYEAWMVSWPVLTDFYLEVTATTGKCSGLDRYGLLARSTSDARSAYLFGFTCDGRYSLRIWDGTKFNILIQWKPAPGINQGSEATNRLGFKAQGSQLTLYANGQPLASIEDDTFTSGAFGLFIGSVLTPNFTVTINELDYWELE